MRVPKPTDRNLANPILQDRTPAMSGEACSLLSERCKKGIAGIKAVDRVWLIEGASRTACVFESDHLMIRHGAYSMLPFVMTDSYTAGLIHRMSPFT